MMRVLRQLKTMTLKTEIVTRMMDEDRAGEI